MSVKPNAFVLMPFDPEFDAIYTDLIRPSLEECGYSVFRADSFLDQQNILRNIVKGIAEASLIVADLTTLNPNVFYELGLCHGLNKPTIMITQSIDDVPFDLQGYKVQVYDTRFDKVERFTSTLNEIARKHLLSEVIFGNPVTDFHAASVSIQDPRQEVTQVEEEASAEGEVEKGFLDFLLEGEEASNRFSSALAEIADDTEHVGERMAVHSAAINEINENPGPGAASRIAKISSIVAADLRSSSSRIEKALPDLDGDVDTLEESFIGFLNWFSPQTDADLEKLKEIRSYTEGLEKVTLESFEQISSYRDSVLGLHGISGEMNRSSRRLAGSISGLLTLTQKTSAFASRTLEIIDEKLKMGDGGGPSEQSPPK